MKFSSTLGYAALISIFVCGAVAGCSGSEPTGAAKEGAVNSVGLALQPVAGVTINAVHFVVSKAGVVAPVLEGDLPTPGTASTFNVGLPIPVGTAYTLSLSGVSVESAAITCTGSIGPFSVTPNQTTKLTTTFSCTDATKGAVDNHVTVTTDACPRLIVDYLVATPGSSNVGGTIGTFSKATDLDGKPVTYAWSIGTASIGSFASATSANTTFTCNGSGVDVPLTLTASNGQCNKSLATTVSCGSLNCGDGIKAPDEVCDPKLTVDNCGRDCGAITSPGCLACEQANQCDDLVGECSQLLGDAAAGSPAAGTPKAYLCNEVLDCVRDSGCAAGGYVPMRCYCGTANHIDCKNGLGDGACKAELERGLETVNYDDIAFRMGSRQHAGGIAITRIDCDQFYCKTACGLN